MNLAYKVYLSKTLKCFVVHVRPRLILPCYVDIVGEAPNRVSFTDFFHQSLQTAVLFMDALDNDDNRSISDDNIKSFLQECLGPSSSEELEFLSECLREGIRYFLEVESHRRFLRLPLIFAEASYMADLRKGYALRALRRIHLICRVEQVISDCVQDIVDGEYRGENGKSASIDA
jgi:hypothetical protein